MQSELFVTLSPGTHCPQGGVVLEERRRGNSNQLLCDRDKKCSESMEGKTCICVEGIDSIEVIGFEMSLKRLCFWPGAGVRAPQQRGVQ